MSDEHTETKTIDESVVGNTKTTVLGGRCECGHTVSAERESARLAVFEVKARKFVHRVRHPLKDWQTANEVLGKIRAGLYNE